MRKSAVARVEVREAILVARLLLWAVLSCIVATRGGESISPDSSSPQDDVAVQALSRLKGMDLEGNPALKAAALQVLQRVKGTLLFVECVRDLQLKGQEPALLEIALDKPSDSAGVEAMRLLLKADDLLAVKQAIDGPSAQKAVEVIAHTADKRAVPLLLGVVSDPHHDVATRKTAVQGLASVQDGAAALLQLAREDKLPQDLRLTAASELNAVRWTALKAQAAELLPLPQTRGAESLPPVSELVKHTGDPMHGIEVFNRETVGCFKCHQIRGKGVDFGPALSEIGTKLAKEAIYESILDPSAGIAFGYEAWQIELKNGDEVFGLINSETAEDVAVKVQGGIVSRYKKADIVSREKQKISIMPTGLQQAMSTQDLVDLVEYLYSLKKLPSAAP